MIAESLLCCLCVQGELLITTSFDKTMKLWTTGGWQPLRVVEGHHDLITGVDMSPSGKYIATACADKTVKLWSTESMDLGI